MIENIGEKAFCPVFKPSREEFSKPFCEYVQDVCRKHPDVAMFKVIPPTGWKARHSKMPDLEDMRIDTPIKQHVRLQILPLSALDFL